MMTSIGNNTYSTQNASHYVRKPSFPENRFLHGSPSNAMSAGYGDDMLNVYGRDVHYDRPVRAVQQPPVPNPVSEENYRLYDILLQRGLPKTEAHHIVDAFVVQRPMPPFNSGYCDSSSVASRRTSVASSEHISDDLSSHLSNLYISSPSRLNSPMSRLISTPQLCEKPRSLAFSRNVSVGALPPEDMLMVYNATTGAPMMVHSSHAIPINDNSSESSSGVSSADQLYNPQRPLMQTPVGREPLIVQSVRSKTVQKPVLQHAGIPAPKHNYRNVNSPCQFASCVASPPPSYSQALDDLSRIQQPSSPNSTTSTEDSGVAMRPPLPVRNDSLYNFETREAILRSGLRTPVYKKYRNVEQPGLPSSRCQMGPPKSIPCNLSVAKKLSKSVNDLLNDSSNFEHSKSVVMGDAGSSPRCLSNSTETLNVSGTSCTSLNRPPIGFKSVDPEAYKFYMEQHMENVVKCQRDRISRRHQLEDEMSQMELPDASKEKMRRLLFQKESNHIRLKRAKMKVEMFEKIKVLGVGAFGEVHLVRKHDTKQLYALKTLKKSHILRRNQVAHVKAERDLLAEADNEWVVKLYYSFQDVDNLYFVMDYIPGGDMMSLLIRKGIFPESLARFYIAELVLAIDSVHKMGFIHRDIKPDNILIDHDGHIKLTDFGLCTGFRWTHESKHYNYGHIRQESIEPSQLQLEKCLKFCQCHREKPLERRRARQHTRRCLAQSLVGTPNYIPPEILLEENYTYCCDWWSVGVILFEMIIGHPPFFADTPATTQAKVIDWKNHLSIPADAHISAEATDLILSLCSDASHRLGKNDSSEIKCHPFFSGLNLETLRLQQALHIPTIVSETDTSNFDPVDELLPGLHCSADNNLDDAAFYEFTFRRFAATDPDSGCYEDPSFFNDVSPNRPPGRPQYPKSVFKDHFSLSNAPTLNLQSPEPPSNFVDRFADSSNYVYNIPRAEFTSNYDPQINVSPLIGSGRSCSRDSMTTVSGHSRGQDSGGRDSIQSRGSGYSCGGSGTDSWRTLRDSGKSAVDSTITRRDSDSEETANLLQNSFRRDIAVAGFNSDSRKDTICTERLPSDFVSEQECPYESQGHLEGKPVFV